MRWCDGDLSIFQDLFLGVYKRWGRCIKGGIERLNYLLFSLTNSSLCCAHSGIFLRMASGRDRLGTPGPIQAGDARGNSTRWGQTFFHLSGPLWGLRHGAARVARVADQPRMAPPVGFPAHSPHGPTSRDREGVVFDRIRKTKTASSRSRLVRFQSHHPTHGGIRHESCPEEHR